MADDARMHDVVLAGPTFFDLVMSGIDAFPSPGTEVYATDMDASPGGLATLAVATARLGLDTALATSLGDDVYGSWCRTLLVDREGIDLTGTELRPGWPTPVTVSLAHSDDRAMITREEPSARGNPLADGARTRAALLDIPTLAAGGDDAWWRQASRDGARIFADGGWDPSGRWDPEALAPLAHCDVFTPNEREARAYTGAASADDAARALAERVPLVVVTRGAEGAVAVDSGTGELVRVPGVAVAARDTTGAGDVLQAALAFGVLRELPLADAVAFAVLCSALSVEELGGAVAAPCWGDIAAWRSASSDPRYDFVDDVLAGIPRPFVRRADRRFPFARFTG